MGLSLISEPLRPERESFDSTRMAQGEPGVPNRFFWKKQEIEILRVLETWKEHGDCTHGSGERYVRKHWYRLLTADGRIIRVYFLRSFGKASSKVASRWWLHSIERLSETTA